MQNMWNNQLGFGKKFKCYLSAFHFGWNPTNFEKNLKIAVLGDKNNVTLSFCSSNVEKELKFCIAEWKS